MEKTCETCYFYHARLKTCMDSFSEKRHTEVRPRDACSEWTESEVVNLEPKEKKNDSQTKAMPAGLPGLLRRLH